MKEGGVTSEKKFFVFFGLVSLVTSCFILNFNPPPVSGKLPFPPVCSPPVCWFLACIYSLPSPLLGLVLRLTQLNWGAKLVFFHIYLFLPERTDFVLSSFQYFFLSENERFVIRTLKLKKKHFLFCSILCACLANVSSSFLSELPEDKAQIN